MDDVRVAPYEPEFAHEWDALVNESTNGTFQHTRRFLAYHGDRFVDRSAVVRAGTRLVAVLPAAEDPARPGQVSSHPGLSFGGLIRRPQLRGEDVVTAFELVIDGLRATGASSFRYKAVPLPYQHPSGADDSYAMFRLGAHRVRCDLAVVVDTARPLEPNSNRRRSLSRARTSGVEVSMDLALLEPYYAVLSERLRERHGATPTHTLDELQLLVGLFPDNIRLATALVGGAVEAGVLTFDSSNVVMAQYIGSSEAGRRSSALDLIFNELLTAATASGTRWFNFGTCNEQEGLVLNQSLYDYKLSFGAGSVACEHFELTL
jgi:hypothetical protein